MNESNSHDDLILYGIFSSATFPRSEERQPRGGCAFRRDSDGLVGPKKASAEKNERRAEAPSITTASENHGYLLPETGPVNQVSDRSPSEIDSARFTLNLANSRSIRRLARERNCDLKRK